MLVLSRHASETIRIGDNIVVSVQRISGNRVIIGIDAPQEVAIRRGELAFDGDAIASADACKAPTESKAPANLDAAKATANSQESASSEGKGASGLAARRRASDRRPLIVPMGERAGDWSASHVS